MSNKLFKSMRQSISYVYTSKDGIQWLRIENGTWYLLDTFREHMSKASVEYTEELENKYNKYSTALMPYL